LRQAALQTYVLVPSIFPVELQNILWTAERRGRSTPVQSNAFWIALSALDIRVQAPASIDTEPYLLIHSRKYGLTSYDMSYLLLAHTERLPLATLDGDLRSVLPA
jgi:predicted nucleic acid-binding protein